MAAAAIANLGHGGDRKTGKDQRGHGTLDPVSQREAAKLFGVERKSVGRAAAIRKEGAPELVF